MDISFSPTLFLAIPLLLVMGFLAMAPHRDRKLKAELKAGNSEQLHLKVYRETATFLWAAGFLSVVCWVLAGYTLSDLGFRTTHAGWRGWVAWGGLGAIIAYSAYSLVAMKFTRSARDGFRKQVKNGGDIDLVRPATVREHRWFQFLSFSAGLHEEIIFRGFIIGVAALFMPVWLAAIIATMLFIIAHMYQGLAGMLRILPISAILATLFVIGGSLWPVIILHILVDSASGAMIAVSDRYDDSDLAAAEGSA